MTHPGYLGMSGRESAWDAVHEVQPAPSCVGHPSTDPGVLLSDGYRGASRMTTDELGRVIGSYAGR
jgi:hypothetical protein